MIPSRQVSTRQALTRRQALAGALLLVARGGAGGRLAGAPAPHDHTVRAGRRRRHRRTHLRRGARQGARPAGRRRQQGRLGRPHGDRGRRARSGRRLHPAADLAGHDGVQHRPLQGAGLRSAQGLRAGHRLRHPHQRGGRLCRQPGQDRRRPGRAGARQAGRDHLRLERRRQQPPHVGRDPGATHRRQHAARALSRRARRGPRRGERRGDVGILQRADGAGPDQGRQAPGARRHHARIARPCCPTCRR